MPAPIRRWRFQLSLRTLVLGSLLAGAGMWTWRVGWQPWKLAYDVSIPKAPVSPGNAALRVEGFSADGTRFFTDFNGPAYDSMTGKVVMHKYGIQTGDVITGRVQNQILQGTHPIHWAQFALDGKHVFAASQESIDKWNLDKKTVEAHWQYALGPYSWHKNLPRLSPLRTTLLRPSRHNELRLNDTASGAELHAFRDTFNGLNDPQFSPDSTLLCLFATSDQGQYVYRFLDVSSGKVVREVVTKAGAVGHCCAFLSDSCFCWIELFGSYPTNLLLHSINPRDANDPGMVLTSEWRVNSPPFLTHNGKWLLFKRDEGKSDKLVVADMLTGRELGWAPIARNIHEDGIRVDPAGHLVTVNVEQMNVWDIHKHDRVFHTPTPATEHYDTHEFPRFHEIELSADGSHMTERHLNGVRIWRHNHPEEWWGVFWMPQAWMVFAFMLGFLWSVRRDNRLSVTK